MGIWPIVPQTRMYTGFQRGHFHFKSGQLPTLFGQFDQNYENIQDRNKQNHPKSGFGHFLNFKSGH